MSYGRMTAFFANADEAREYLENCRRANNYSAENYQDRVAAQHCIRKAEGWAAPPIVDFEPSRSSQPPVRRRRVS